MPLKRRGSPGPGSAQALEIEQAFGENGAINGCSARWERGRPSRVGRASRTQSAIDSLSYRGPESLTAVFADNPRRFAATQSGSRCHMLSRPPFSYELLSLGNLGGCHMLDDNVAAFSGVFKAC